MAASTKPLLCRYYLSGICRDGSSCRYSHDRENSVVDMVCRYYLMGCCTYGANCRYDHEKPRPASPAHPTPSSFPSTPFTVSPVTENTRPDPPDFQSYVPETESKLIDLWDQEIQDDLDTFYSSGMWSSAPSTSDKVILSGGRIKTKADWVKDSPVFIPQAHDTVPAPSYAQITETSATPKDSCPDHSVELPYSPDTPDKTCNDTPQSEVFCPYRVCPDKERCNYTHGDLCDMCGTAILHPTDAEQRQKHKLKCAQEFEEEMEYSFLFAESKEKECSICMEVVVDKPSPENRFGLLPNCTHIFCLTCIRTWRSSTLEKEVVRACPECRITSNYVIPSDVWAEDKEEKGRIIAKYKTMMKFKACKYFDEGRKTCPFGDSCFYRHAYPDGTPAVPQPHAKRRHRADANGRVSTVNSYLLWDFINQRERPSFDDDDDDDDDDFDYYDAYGSYSTSSESEDNS